MSARIDCPIGPFLWLFVRFIFLSWAHSPMSPLHYRKTRFVCVSDTHNASPIGAFKLPKGDVLIHAGDLTNQGSHSELRKTIDWIEKADFEEKIVVAGTTYTVRCINNDSRLQATTTSPWTRNSTLSTENIFTINILKMMRRAGKCWRTLQSTTCNTARWSLH